jgi:hypothetical protein
MSWAPQPKLVALGWVLAAVAGVFALVTGDRPGQVLLAMAAVVLLLAAAHGTFTRPRLHADPTGLTVRGLSGRRHFRWNDVTVRVVRTRRLGRDVATLEIDGEDDLVVLGYLELGADPEDVADALHRLRATG